MKQLQLLPWSKLAFLRSKCNKYQSETEVGNQSASVFSFPLRSTLPCMFHSSKSTVHLAYIYRVHKYNINPLNGPHGRQMGKQMCDFTFKIEPSSDNLNILAAYMKIWNRKRWIILTAFDCIQQLICQKNCLLAVPKSNLPKNYKFKHLASVSNAEI